MRKLLFIFAMLMPFLMSAQDAVQFVLTSDGLYKAENGEDYIVVPFEGKSSHQIYQELASNINSLYNKPSEVMTGVEDASIKVRAISDDIIRARLMGLGQSESGYYQLEFKIKDGRVRVSAPYIEPQVWYVTNKGRSYSDFAPLVKKHFNKDGSLKDGKRAEDYAIIVSKMNGIINAILNLSASQDSSEDW